MKKHKLLLIIIVITQLLINASAFGEEKTWFSLYQQAGSFVNQGEMDKAAAAYYRAQLASSWARELRPSAFVGNGNDPGTVRAALNQVIGQSVNPWAFKEVKNRLIPILDDILSEVEQIRTEEQLDSSIFSGLTASQKKEEAEGTLTKYPYVIPKNQRIEKFKTFAKNWVEEGKTAATGGK
jgi:hypothetical protein